MSSPARSPDTESGESSGHPVAVAPGWRLADAVAPPAGYDPDRSRRLRRRVAAAVVVVVLALEAVGALVWIADTHYERGKQALAGGLYQTAIQEFQAARVLVVPWRDATELEQQARQGLAQERARLRRARRHEARIAGLAGTATGQLQAGQWQAAARTVRSLRDLVPEGALGTQPATKAAVKELTSALTAKVRAALAAGRWERAGLLTGALVLLQPDAREAKRLAAEAALATVLQEQLDKARAAAAAGRWRRALRLALAVLARRPDFPGASQLADQARAALKPKPASTQAGTAATSTATPEAATPTAASTPAAPAPAPP